jgi:hypothetical protein
MQRWPFSKARRWRLSLFLPEQRLFTSGGLGEALSIKLEDPLPLDRHEPPPPSARFFVKKDHPPQFIDKKDHL